MQAKKKVRKLQSTRIAVLFGSVVFVLIIFSLIGKLWILVSESKFDGQHQFILQVVMSSQKSDLIVFEPDANNLTVLSVSGKGANQSAEQSIQMPIDATVQSSVGNDASSSFVSSVLEHSLFHDNTDMSPLDVLHLLFFAKAASEQPMRSLSIPTDPNTISSIVTSVATDATIYKEGYSVSIVNASGVSGVGTALSKLLTNVGVNVISVTTSDNNISASSIVYDTKKSYTVSRIAEICNIPASQTSEQNIADITITIGEDRGNKFAASL